MKVGDLSSAPYNPRKITDKKLRMLLKSMKEFGDLSGIVFNVRTGRVIGGHQRLKHLDPTWSIEKETIAEDSVGTVATGWIETPFGRWTYREVDWPGEKEIMANVAANKHGGEFDYPLLKDLVVSIDDGSKDLELTGFDNDELKKVFGVVGFAKDQNVGSIQYAIVVECENETSQAALLERLEKEGLKCRLLML